MNNFVSSQLFIMYYELRQNYDNETSNKIIYYLFKICFHEVLKQYLIVKVLISVFNVHMVTPIICIKCLVDCTHIFNE